MQRNNNNRTSNDNGMVVNHEGSINLNNEEDFCMMAMIEDYDENSTPTENWYADSGATVHITNDGTNLFNIRQCKFNVTVGDGFSVKCEKMGDLKLEIEQDEGTIPLLLKNVRLVPDFNCNLFSLTTALAHNNVTITAKGREMAL